MADFRREYGIDTHGLSDLSVSEFLWLLQGISSKARFALAWDNAAKHIYDPDEIAAVHALARK